MPKEIIRELALEFGTESLRPGALSCARLMGTVTKKHATKAAVKAMRLAR